MNITSGLAEGQVLQRNGSRGASVELRGTCRETGPITLTISGKNGVLQGWNSRSSGTAGGAGFRIKLANIPAGGPYRLELRCRNKRSIVREFFVGDVWLLAGQSNMEGVGNISGAASPHPLIRSFSMRRTWMRAQEPLHLLAESPDFCHNGGIQCPPAHSRAARRTAGKGVGPGLFFAHEMLRRSGVPQGLVCTAHGGTSMSQWNPVRMEQGRLTLYGSMLTSVQTTGQPVAGVLWYQGESDANPDAVPLYVARMRKLVATLRKDLRLPDLTWLTVQIGRVFQNRPPAGVVAWNRIQELQGILPRSIRNLSVVAAVDLPMDDHIHISAQGHSLLAQRLACEADRLVYGNRREAAPPKLRSISFLKSSMEALGFPGCFVDVTYENVAGELKAVGEPAGFAVVDTNGDDLRAIYRTTLLGNTARLFVGPVDPANTRLCYGLGTSPTCNITDGRGHGLPVFEPRSLGNPRAYLPFVKRWKVTAPVPATARLDRLPVPDLQAIGSKTRTYGDNEFNLEGFINERQRWAGHDGCCFFSAELGLSEPMRLQFLMGYDGPFRVWIDGKPFFIDMAGINPCVSDKSRKSISLSAGRHTIHVAMDLNHGQAWGFFLRFIRGDLTRAQILSGKFARPVYRV